MRHRRHPAGVAAQPPGVQRYMPFALSLSAGRVAPAHRRAQVRPSSARTDRADWTPIAIGPGNTASSREQRSGAPTARRRPSTVGKIAWRRPPCSSNALCSGHARSRADGMVRGSATVVVRLARRLAGIRIGENGTDPTACAPPFTRPTMPIALDLPVLSTFTLLWLAIVPTPGPNVLLVTHVAVTRTPAHVAFAIAGNMGGIVLLASLALLGWAAMLHAFPWLRLGVSIFGGLYLSWVGWRLIRRARTGSVAAASGPRAVGATAADYRRTATLGFVTALSNAQAILFITSIYALTGVLNANMATGFATIVIMVCCNASYLGAIGWLFQRAKMRTAYARFRGVLDGTIGTLFVLFGGRMLWRALAR